MPLALVLVGVGVDIFDFGRIGGRDDFVDVQTRACVKEVRAWTW